MTTTEEEAAVWPGPATTPTDGPLTFEELALAGRNRGMPLEALRYDITPTGMHYLLVHFDIPGGRRRRRGGCASTASSTGRSSSRWPTFAPDRA